MAHGEPRRNTLSYRQNIVIKGGFAGKQRVVSLEPRDLAEVIQPT